MGAHWRKESMNARKRDANRHILLRKVSNRTPVLAVYVRSETEHMGFDETRRGAAKA
jgi:hypothetical protein